MYHTCLFFPTYQSLILPPTPKFQHNRLFIPTTILELKQCLMSGWTLKPCASMPALQILHKRTTWVAVGPSYPVGYSHVKAYRDVPPKWVTFWPKILRHGSQFGHKKSLEEGPISQNMKKKNVKSAIFEAEKPLKMGIDLRKFRKKCLFSRFLIEKNHKIWVGVSDLGPHNPFKNNLSTPLPPPPAVT